MGKEDAPFICEISINLNHSKFYIINLLWDNIILIINFLSWESKKKKKGKEVWNWAYDRFMTDSGCAGNAWNLPDMEGIHIDDWRTCS